MAIKMTQPLENGMATKKLIDAKDISVNSDNNTSVTEELNKKQNTITDLADIRAGAAKGATALQAHQDISGKADKSEVATSIASLQSAIESEASARASAISAEASARASAISAEEEQRTEDIAQLGTELDTERTERQEGDEGLQNQIGDLNALSPDIAGDSLVDTITNLYEAVDVQTTIEKAQNARDSADEASASEANAKQSEANASASATASAESEANADKYATEANASALAAAASAKSVQDMGDHAQQIIDAAAQLEEYIGQGKQFTTVTVTSAIEGVSVAGIILNVYFNGSTINPTEVQLDENGMGRFRVPIDYQYRIVFPNLEGGYSIAPANFRANGGTRHHDFVYTEQGTQIEAVVVSFRKLSGTSTSVFKGDDGAYLNLTLDGKTTRYNADASGDVKFTIPIGAQYSFQIGNLEEAGWYSHENKYVYSLKAEMTARFIVVYYSDTVNGVYIMTRYGEKYNFEKFQALVEEGTLERSDGRLICIESSQLHKAGLTEEGLFDHAMGGIFAVVVDDLRQNKTLGNLTWASSNVQFNSIPNTDQRFNGLHDSRLVAEEGVNRQLSTPATTAALKVGYRIFDKSDEVDKGTILPGFLGAAQQWNALWANKEIVDAMLEYLRPADEEGKFTRADDDTQQTAKTLSIFTTNKWTSSRDGSANAWYFTAALYNLGKTNTFAVFPFYAY